MAKILVDAALVNPARAGMIRHSSPPAPACRGKPRASGDDPRTCADDAADVP